ncbi:hypothetical protein PUN28_008025 [Cardiocondyla obscurior]|uniref:Uncharacterized protein n=1 Tax=Cardiocondyla obscurior TaxID=286306 RepID=A0AAW2FXE1_9HYME
MDHTIYTFSVSHEFLNLPEFLIDFLLIKISKNFHTKKLLPGRKHFLEKYTHYDTCNLLILPLAFNTTLMSRRHCGSDGLKLQRRNIS